MPVVGGIYKGEKARHVVENLCLELKNHIGSSTCMIESNTEDTNTGITIAFGLEEYESHQELQVRFNNNEGLLLGRLFSKDFKSYDPQALNIGAIKKTQGRFLGEHFWGRYILILTSPDSINIYRDPQGLETLFYMPIEGGYIFASSISLLFDHCAKKPTIYWPYLLSFVGRSAHSVTAITPFTEIKEALPGCSTTLQIGSSPIISPFWNPLDYSVSFIDQEELFEEKLYDTILKCTASWIAGVTHLKNELSGGVDSSSLVAIMKKNDPSCSMSAYNMYHSLVSSSDERGFAQEVADKYRVPLTFFDLKEAPFFDQISTSTRADRPCMGRLGATTLPLMKIQRDEERISGQGGDHLFFAGAPLEVIIDYYHEQGIKGILTKIQDVASFYRMPYYKALQKTIRLYLDNKKGSLLHLNQLDINESWMKEEFKQQIDASIFKPYFWETLKSVPPGKALHILSIYSATLSIDRGHSSGQKNTLYPLLSQPVVEVALAIPSYKAVSKGYDRYIFRKAMERHLEGQFIWRKSKGESSGALILGLRKNFQRVSSFLLDGHLVALGYIDPNKLNYSLAQVKHGNIQPLWPILNLYVVEQWLESWKM